MRAPLGPALLGAIAVLVLLGALSLGSRWLEGLPPFGAADDQWAAVVLVDGKAYYGHFASPPGRMARLREPYTLESSPIPNSTQVNLVPQRVTANVVGPKPEMQIDKRRIVLIEELRADSQVVQAILSDKAR